MHCTSHVGPSGAELYDWTATALQVGRTASVGVPSFGTCALQPDSSCQHTVVLAVEILKNLDDANTDESLKATSELLLCLAFARVT